MSATSKGGRTRAEIIDKAFLLAGEIGLENVTLGTLAGETGLSKSGLFAHFKSKEALQLDLLEDVRNRFIAQVIVPSANEPRGERRVRAFLSHYLNWIETSHPKGGCLYMALSFEYDDRPGPIRDKVLVNHLDLADTIRRIVQTAVDEGEFRPDLDTERFFYEVMGIVMAYHHRAKFLQLPNARAYAASAFEALVERSRAPA